MRWFPGPELRETATNHGKNDQSMSDNSQKYHNNMAKTTICCPKLTTRGSNISEKFQAARIKDFIL